VCLVLVTGLRFYSYKNSSNSNNSNNTKISLTSSLAKNECNLASHFLRGLVLPATCGSAATLFIVWVSVRSANNPLTSEMVLVRLHLTLPLRLDWSPWFSCLSIAIVVLRLLCLLVLGGFICQQKRSERSELWEEELSLSVSLSLSKKDQITSNLFSSCFCLGNIA